MVTYGLKRLGYLAFLFGARLKNNVIGRKENVMSQR
jgi:hypothetical protein